jgi:hypothetical protein
MLTVILSVSANDRTLMLSNDDKLSSGSVHLHPYILESVCVIPDHNGGEWGCEENTVSLWQTVGHVTEIVIKNLSDPLLSSVVLCDIGRDEVASVPLIDDRDSALAYGLKIIDGENRFEVVVYENQKLIWREELILNVTQKNRF